jgi:hypothetical protein
MILSVYDPDLINITANTYLYGAGAPTPMQALITVVPIVITAENGYL